MTRLRSIISKLAKEIDLIASTDPSHRISMENRRDLAHLVQAINNLADRYEKISINTEGRIQLVRAEIEEEKGVLAAFISELPEGVLVCNAEGQILLYNRGAGEFLFIDENSRLSDGSESEPFTFLGRSISTVINRNLIEHALDEINEKLKRNALDAASHFTFKGKGDHVFRTRAAPILGSTGQFAGFILVLNDITQQEEVDNRVDSLLQALTKSARSPLASIRAAIELILEYPDMDSLRLQQFREIIHKNRNY